MFCLEHNDPTLTTLVIGDTFKYMNLRQGTSMTDVLNALYMHDHVRELIMAWDDDDMHLWWDPSVYGTIFKANRSRGSSRRPPMGPTTPPTAPQPYQLTTLLPSHPD